MKTQNNKPTSENSSRAALPWLALPAAALLALAIFSSGCSGMKWLTHDYGYPRPYKFESATMVKHSYTNNLFRQDYDRYMSNYLANIGSNQLDYAKVERNAILGELMYMIEASHGEFERDTRAWKNMSDFLGDIAILGVNSAGAASGSLETAKLMNLISGGIAGTQFAANKRLLAEQALEAIQTQMRAAMKERKATIVTNMNADVLKYSLEMGMSDVVNYYYDGTITRAIQDISVAAKKSEKDAEKSVTDAIKSSGTNSPSTASTNTVK